MNWGSIMSKLFKSGESQKGFTLIEMSIVLVIIGLIIGGILKGQEIIESSRQKNLISQVDSVRAALTTFVDRYNQLPGDYTLATTRINGDDDFVNGNGDGLVDENATDPGSADGIADTDGDAAGDEELQFWIHLYGAHLIEGVAAVNAPGTAFGEGNPKPATAFPGAGLSLTYGTYDDFAADTVQGHWLVVARNPATPAAALTGRQMYALDVKVDDGIPSRGTFRSDLAAAACGTNGGTADYGLAETISCRAVIQLVQ